MASSIRAGFVAAACEMRRVRRRCWVVLVLGCGGDSTDGNTTAITDAGATQATALGTVRRVEIVPPVVHALPGVKVPLRAIGRYADNSPVPGSPPVVWSGNVVYSDVAANPAHARSSVHGDHPVEVKLGGQRGMGKFIVGSASDAYDQIRLPHSDGQPISAVLIDAKDHTSSDCHQDKTLGIAGLAVLTENLTAGCNSSFGVFVEGKGAVYECLKETTQSQCSTGSRWTDAADDVNIVQLPPELRVDVVVWYRVNLPDADAVSNATDDLAYASEIFSGRRAGMRFNRAAGGGADGTIRNFEAAAGPDPCEGADGQLGIARVEGALNVVYVEEIVFGTDRDVRGLMCAWSDGGPPLIVLSRLEMVSATPAHELAHTMALSQRVFTDWRGGHTYLLDTFDQTNLMWAEENATIGLERDHLSLGQVLRIVADERSWVNVIRGGGLGRIRTGDTETCQAKRDSNDPCPVLHQEVGIP